MNVSGTSLSSLLSRRKEIVNFWVNKMNYWSAPSGHVGFWQVFRLHKLIDLHEFPDHAVHLMFSYQDRVDYEFKVVTDPFGYVCSYRWGQQEDWVTSKGACLVQATKSAAMNVLKFTLGNQLHDLLRITDKEKYQDIDHTLLHAELHEKVGKYIFTPAFRPNFQCKTSFSGPRNGSPAPSASFSHDQQLLQEVEKIALNLSAKTISKLTVEQRKTLLESLWTERIKRSDRFPLVFNLIDSRNMKESNALNNFQKLFSLNREERNKLLGKSVISQSTVTSCVCFQFSFNDNKALVMAWGRNLNDAQNRAGMLGMDMVLGKEEIRLLEHLTKSFFWQCIHVEEIKQKVISNYRKLTNSVWRTHEHSSLEGHQQIKHPRLISPEVSFTSTARITGDPSVPASPSCTRIPVSPTNEETVDPTCNTLQTLVKSSAALHNILTPGRLSQEEERCTSTQMTFYKNHSVSVQSNTTVNLQSDPRSINTNTTVIIQLQQSLNEHEHDTQNAVISCDFEKSRDPGRPGDIHKKDVQLSECDVTPVMPKSAVTNNMLQELIPWRLIPVDKSPARPRRPTPPPPRPPKDEFWEYFSTNMDGTTQIPWYILCKNSLNTNTHKEPDDYSSKKKVDPPFLPFDKLLGQDLIKKAAFSLDSLFEGRIERDPIYETTKYYISECRLENGHTFRAFATSVEEARCKASQLALDYLTSNDSCS